jgi:hypothetical protein
MPRLPDQPPFARLLEDPHCGRDPGGLAPDGRADGSAEDLPLFLFGTLRDPDLFRVVFGRPQTALPCRPAHLPGHAAMRVAGGDFPVLVARPECRQPGLLVEGLAPAEIARAVFYESSGYRLAPVRLRVTAAAVTARAFLPTGRLPASSTRWRLAAWQRRHGRRVATAAELAFEHYGRVDADGFDALWPEIERETAARLAAAAGGPGRG